MSFDGDVEFREMNATDGDVRLFADCFSENGSPRDAEAVDWQFRNNPTGRLIVDFGVARGSESQKLAAIYAVLPVRVRVDGRTGFAVQSVDTMTDSAFRGRGLFLKLAKSCYERAANDGALFVYGFPNGNSAHGFFERLGWKSLDPLPFLIRPLRTRYVASRLVPERVSRHVPSLRLPIGRRALPTDYRIAPLGLDDVRMTAVWSDFSSGVGVAVERDAEYFRWRLSRPRANYCALGVFDGARLVAFGIYCVSDKHGGRVGYVVDLLHLRKEKSSALALLNTMLREMTADGADVALAWNLRQSPNHSAFRWAGFVPLPERLRPVELHFGARSFQDDGATSINRGSWYLSYCDSDTV